MKKDIALKSDITKDFSDIKIESERKMSSCEIIIKHENKNINKCKKRRFWKRVKSFFRMGEFFQIYSEAAFYSHYL